VKHVLPSLATDARWQLGLKSVTGDQIKVCFSHLLDPGASFEKLVLPSLATDAHW
jgi:hypothetical protein